VVNEEPSEVLVKLKKLTVDGRPLLEPAVVSTSLKFGFRALGVGSMGERGAIRRFVTGLNEGPIVFNDMLTSG
jgi:hypothetical protein